MKLADLANKNFAFVCIMAILIFAAVIYLFPTWLFHSSPNYFIAVVGESGMVQGELAYDRDGRVINDNLGLLDLLNMEDFRLAGVDPVVGLWQDSLVPGVLNPFDTVILYNATFCDRTARQVLADYVLSGGNLIVVGDACTRVVDSPRSGWDVEPSLQSVMPAAFGTVQPVDSKLKIFAFDHPLFNGIKNYVVSQDVAFVMPDKNATVLAFINSSDVQSGNAVYAILEKKSGLGKVMYFAYAPIFYGGSGSRNLMLNLLLYLGNRKK